jgi:hypothetical protein
MLCVLVTDPGEQQSIQSEDISKNTDRLPTSLHGAFFLLAASFFHGTVRSSGLSCPTILRLVQVLVPNCNTRKECNTNIGPLT